MPKEQGELILCNIKALNIDGTEEEEANVDMVPDVQAEQKTSATAKGEFIRQKLKLGTATEEKRKKKAASAGASSSSEVPVPPAGRLQAELIYTNGSRIEHASAYLELPTYDYTCRSPAELMGKTLIDVPTDDPKLPASVWRQLGSLETDESIIQIQFVRMAQASAKFSSSPSESEKLRRCINCFAVGTVFVSTKKVDVPDLDPSIFETINKPLEETNTNAGITAA